MAEYYWIGGNGTWNGANTANWSLTSGGAGGAGPPLVTDTVYFNANSGTGTCTTASGSTCKDMTLDSSTLVVTLGANHTTSNIFNMTTGTLNLGSSKLTCTYFFSTGSNTRNINFGTGDITLTGNATAIWSVPIGTNLTLTGSLNVNSTYAGATGARTFANATSTGKGPTKAVNINITAGTDSINLPNAGYVKNVDFTGFSGTLNNVATNVVGDLTISSGMTLAAGANGLSFNAPSGTTQKITTAGKTFNFPINVGNDTNAFTVVEMQDALTMGSTRNLDIARGTLKLKNGVTTTVGGLTTSTSDAKTLSSTVAGSRATLSKASGTVSVSNMTIKDIDATGGATWQAYVTNNNVDAGNNLGWDFALQVGKYMYSRRKNKRVLP